MRPWLCLALCTLAGCTAPRSPEGGACVFNDDCASPLVCAGRRCRLPCRDDRDCVSPFTCQHTERAGVRVCLPPGWPAPCLYTQDCLAGELCCFGQCAQSCSAGPCPEGMARNASNACAPLPDASASNADGGPTADAREAGASEAGLDAALEASAEGGADAFADALVLDAAAPDAADAEAGAVVEAGVDGGSVPPFVSLCAGGQQTCGLTATGDVWCWGGNQWGALGRGTAPSSPDPQPTPAPVAGLHDVLALRCGATARGNPAGEAQFACGLLADGAVRCWGGGPSTSRGVLGVAAPGSSGTPLPVPGLGDAVGLGAGGEFACAVRASAEVWCWGAGYLGQLGQGAIATNDPSPVRVRLPELAREVLPGATHACARGLASGALFCWGNNGAGQFGTTLLHRETPYPVAALFTSVDVSAAPALFVGGETGCAVLAGGEARCWGNDLRGAAGVPPYNLLLSVEEPTVVAGVGPALALAPGYFASCALRADRTVQCFGQNTSGLLGEGSTAATPNRLGAVLPVRNVVEVTMGTLHACALDADGVAWCWGSNAQGQLGRPNSLSNSPTPLAVR